MQFKSWPKIPRFEKEEWIFTEKIDGTNAVIAIDESNNIKFGSRTRWLTMNVTIFGSDQISIIDDDNHGFAKWGIENKEELLKLGPGYHYGEWYGAGIQRGYGLTEKRFALFYLAKNAVLPSCCQIVPTLNVGFGKPVINILKGINLATSLLKEVGSILVPGYRNPEGFIIRSTLTGQRYKVILDE